MLKVITYMLMSSVITVVGDKILQLYENFTIPVVFWDIALDFVLVLGLMILAVVLTWIDFGWESRGD